MADDPKSDDAKVGAPAPAQLTPSKPVSAEPMSNGPGQAEHISNEAAGAATSAVAQNPQQAQKPSPGQSPEQDPPQASEQAPKGPARLARMAHLSRLAPIALKRISRWGRTSLAPNIKTKRPKISALNASGRATAFSLSLAGALPFVFATLVQFVPLLPADYAYLTLPGVLWYGAVILSFLGGIRWGLALRVVDSAQRNRLMVLSVLPSLLGWFALFLPVNYALFALILGFSGQGAWDVGSAEQSGAPPWFTTLRLVLTLIVVGSLIGLAVAIADPLGP